MIRIIEEDELGIKAKDVGIYTHGSSVDVSQQLPDFYHHAPREIGFRRFPHVYS